MKSSSATQQSTEAMFLKYPMRTLHTGWACGNVACTSEEAEHRLLVSGAVDVALLDCHATQ